VRNVNSGVILFTVYLKTLSAFKIIALNDITNNEYCDGKNLKGGGDLPV
jgi:hypothetical protein